MQATPQPPLVPLSPPLHHQFSNGICPVLFSMHRAHHLLVGALAANYLDRVLTAIHVRPSRLQPLANACLVLACKLSHGYVPKGLCKLWDEQFELPILQALRWRLVVPTSFSFLPHFAIMFRIPHSVMGQVYLNAEKYVLRKSFSNRV